MKIDVDIVNQSDDIGIAMGHVDVDIDEGPVDVVDDISMSISTSIKA